MESDLPMEYLQQAPSPPHHTQEDQMQLSNIVHQILHEAQEDLNLQGLVSSIDPIVLLN